MADKGWIKLHRQILESGIWLSDEPFDRRSAWVDLLMLANHEDREIFVNGCPLLIKRGQKFTSIRWLSEHWHWSKDKTTRYINLLVLAKMVTKDATHNGTLLTIENYEKFQGQCDTEPDANRTQARTKSGRKTATNKNERMLKNEKNERIEAPPLLNCRGEMLE